MVELLLVMGLVAAGSLLSVLFGGDSDDGDDRAADGSSETDEPGQELRGGPSDDLLLGGAGDDSIVGNLGNDTLAGGAGDDLLLGRGGDDQIDGDAGEDSISGERGMDRLFGGTGDDLLDGGEGDDLLNGGNGADTLLGGGNDDVMRGGAGNDLLLGGFGEDLLQGNGGADTLDGEGGDDVLEGGEGSDQLFGAEGSDVLIGVLRADGASVVSGGEQILPATDVVDPDTLYGGPGEDLMILGRGDIAYGGGAEDTFAVGSWMTASTDTGVIADFEPTGEEILVLLPQTYAGAGVVTILGENTDALVQVDGQTYARVTGAAATLTPAMVSVVLTPFVVAV